MSERIDVRADIAIAGTPGNAVRGELTALTRRAAAGQAILFRQASSCTALRGARRSLRPIAGIRESRPAVFTRTRRAPSP